MKLVRTFAMALFLLPLVAGAHSASDAYLTLTAVKGGAATTRIEVQWDIALRDLHFVLALDDDGDGSLTWGEVRKHAPQIARYAYENLRASGDGKACAFEPARHAIAAHADGAYAALFFTIVCDGALRKLGLDYRLLFAVDPSHRAIVVFNSPGGTATSLLSPDNSQVHFALPAR
jgi:hypothetical protein